ncbi:MAG: zf-HC2 domain-containing protein [Thermoanaerobaculia bacterium]
MNHDRLREDLDLELDAWNGLDAHDDGETLLTPAESSALQEHLAGCAECRSEGESLRALHESLRASIVSPREGFAREVMRALPPAPWEARALVVWRWPFALLLTLGGVAAVLLGGAAAELEPHAGSLDAFLALARLLQSAALAGAGLLGASWRGLGSGLAEWIAVSKLHLAGAGVALVALNVLFLRLLRPAARASAGAPGSASGGRSTPKSR